LADIRWASGVERQTSERLQERKGDFGNGNGGDKSKGCGNSSSYKDNRSNDQEQQRRLARKKRKRLQTAHLFLTMSKQLNEADRVAICRKKRENPDITQAQLVKWVKENIGKSVTQGTISNTLKRSAEFLAEDVVVDAKRQRQRKVS